MLQRSAGLSSRLGPRTGYALLVFWLAVPFVHAYTEDNSMRFDPDPGKTAFRNGINALSYHLVWDRLINAGSEEGMLYPDYSLRRIAAPSLPTPLNLVVIMGESITYTHMGLYGYGRDTTPFLSGLEAKERLIFRPGISSAVSTHVSIPMFLTFSTNRTTEPISLRAKPISTDWQNRRAIRRRLSPRRRCMRLPPKSPRARSIPGGR